MAEETGRPPQKPYDYLLKFLLVGDSDVGKQEILSELDDGASESPFCSGSGKCTYYPFTLFLYNSFVLHSATTRILANSASDFVLCLLFLFHLFVVVESSCCSSSRYRVGVKHFFFKV